MLNQILTLLVITMTVCFFKDFITTIIIIAVIIMIYMYINGKNDMFGGLLNENTVYELLNKGTKMFKN